MGESEVDWIANEGVRISRICRRLRAAPLSGPEAVRRDQLLEAPAVTQAGPAPRAPMAPLAAGERVHASLVRLTEARTEPFVVFESFPA
jgi:hypothetical protein